jgi:hypothetical protein
MDIPLLCYEVIALLMACLMVEARRKRVSLISRQQQ